MEIVLSKQWGKRFERMAIALPPEKVEQLLGPSGEQPMHWVPCSRIKVVNLHSGSLLP